MHAPRRQLAGCRSHRPLRGNFSTGAWCLVQTLTRCTEADVGAVAGPRLTHATQIPAAAPCVKNRCNLLRSLLVCTHRETVRAPEASL